MSNSAEIIGEVVYVAAGCWSRCRRFLGFNEVAVEATTIVGDAEPGVEGERRALIEHNAGEIERCHRVLRWMLDNTPTWRASCRCFTAIPTEGYP
jgi:hypothetical protein